MRVAYFHNAPLPGKAANTVNVAKMCAAFGSNGHQVTLFMPRLTVACGDGDEIAGVYQLACAFPVCSIWQPAWPGGSRLFAWLMTRAVQAVGPDLAYGRDVVVAAMVARLGIPVAFEAHISFEDMGPRSHAAFKRLVRTPAFRRLVVISAALGKAFEEAFPEVADRIVVAHDGADAIEALTADAPRSPYAPSGALRVGYAGHLYPGKGMEIVAELAERCPWAEFHVVGGMPTDIEAWRGNLQSHTNVIFHGFVPHAEVTDHVRRFDVAIAPYQRTTRVSDGQTDVARWMSPLKIFEYMAHGKAIVCSRLPVLEEILEDGQTACLCEPDDIDAWTTTLQALHEDPSRRAALGRRAQAMFEQRYTWRKRAESVLDGLG